MIAGLMALSVRARWAVVFFIAIVSAIGMWQLTRLPIDAVPDITNKQVQVNTVDPGLSPADIEKRVTFPIETALAGIPGLESTRSVSRNGFSQVTAVFKENVDLYFARQQVSERISQARENLPEGLQPQIGPVTTGLGEVFMYTVDFTNPGGKGAKVRDGQPGWQSDGSYLTPEGERLTDEVSRAAYLRTVQDWIISPQLRTVPGVAGVDSIGGFEKQYLVEPDPVKLNAYGVSFSDLAKALEAANLSVDVATVRIGGELRTGAASMNGHEVVVGTALMLIGENSRTVAKAVGEKLETLEKSLPVGVAVKPTLDRSKLVNATIATVQRNLFEGAVLVAIALFFLLGNVRAALIAVLIIPISFLMTAIGMNTLGVSGNLMSLGALDFGLIVDGAVIIIENCLRRLAERQHHEGRLLDLRERLEETMLASQEMIRPTVYGQAIIFLVFAPLLTFQGVEGKTFSPMAITLMLALAAAFILSLTFVPAMVALLIRGKVAEKEVWLIRKVNQHYIPLLHRAVARPWPFIGAAVGVFALAGFVFTLLGQEFIPQLDEKNVAVASQRIPSTSLEQSLRMQRGVERAITSLPEVELMFSKTGTAEVATDPMPPNISDGFVLLKPQKDWPKGVKTKEDVIARIEAKTGALIGQGYELSQPIELRFNELIGGVRGDVAVKIYGDDLEKMTATGTRIAAALSSTPGAADVKVEQVSGAPTLDVQFDRAAIARFGLTVEEVADTVAAAMAGREAGMLFEGDRRFDVVVRVPAATRASLDALGALPVMLPGEDGHARGSVPLSQLAQFRYTEGLNQISRENGKRRVVVSANVRGRDVGSFVKAAQPKVEEVALPPGTFIEWGGQFQNLQAASQRLAIVVPICFLAIFALLYMALGSTPLAVAVFAAIPLGLAGGVFTLALTRINFSVSAAVGFIVLAGVAVLNGLVVMSAIRQRLDGGMPITQAITEGMMEKVRPVVMTGLVPAIGFIPMALAHGTGAEVQKPLAMVVIGGLVTATALTLLVLPAITQVLLAFAERRKRRPHADASLMPAE
ncbi:efflux RND transporter permease subunit [Phenylobacterium sp. CCH12-B4]|uniref:efflux RND transporter permease subunit n=1 Tax=Phenylobacterium sp. CCH12-B4 TaxID=1768784 RepID=UPI00083B8827|nr:CusA/CzcA family heavy metal efflux RND transporter [Phenylobacterium sp. CCH12-B4]